MFIIREDTLGIDPMAPCLCNRLIICLSTEPVLIITVDERIHSDQFSCLRHQQRADHPLLFFFFFGFVLLLFFWLKL